MFAGIIKFEFCVGPKFHSWLLRTFDSLQPLPKIHTSHQYLEDLEWFEAIFKIFGFWGHWGQKTMEVEFWECGLLRFCNHFWKYVYLIEYPILDRNIKRNLTWIELKKEIILELEASTQQQRFHRIFLNSAVRLDLWGLSHPARKKNIWTKIATLSCLPAVRSSLDVRP